MTKTKENKEENKEEVGVWEMSPITNKSEVVVEYDKETGSADKLCIGSGFFTNEYPLNYKKHPDYNIEEYEEGMPQIMKDLRFDDGESYWYPTSIRTTRGMVFPAGESAEEHKWCFAPVEKLTPSEKEDAVKSGYEEKLDMKNAKMYDRFMDASKHLNGMDWNELPE